MEEHIDTRTLLLDAAQHLVQTQGYNAFSYADIAARVGIRKASIHYHFPSKSALGRALIVRYRTRFRQSLSLIKEKSKNAFDALKHYVGLYSAVMQVEHHMCLCGILAAEMETLPQAMKEELQGFFAENVVWLTAVLEEGLRTKTVTYTGSAEAEAQSLVAGLQGAMLVSRVSANSFWFETATQQMLVRLQASPS
ncbi:MAG TPA: TetR/AcrR family transcriptional regulator [Ktedonobacteraceae bacterium]|nr:TetR/AcrR family transcriptional regulator [Ktedonobacteraceae bacterium]